MKIAIHQKSLVLIALLTGVIATFQACSTPGKFSSNPIEDYTNHANEALKDRGIPGGHINVMTSNSTGSFFKGNADHTSIAYDDVFNKRLIDFFNLEDPKLYTIDERVLRKKKFYIILSNGHLTSGGMLQINNDIFNIRDYYKRSLQFQKGNLNALKPYTLSTQSQIALLKNFQVLLFDDSIAKGHLPQTHKTCVSKNVPGPSGEYRNGALVLQIIDADTISFKPITKTAAEKSLLWEAAIYQDNKKISCL